MITDLTEEQRNQLVVALRFWQETVESKAIPPAYGIFFDELRPLGVDEIETLIDLVHEWE
jgi:hypothetical protein